MSMNTPWRCSKVHSYPCNRYDNQSGFMLINYFISTKPQNTRNLEGVAIRHGQTITDPKLLLDMGRIANFLFQPLSVLVLVVCPSQTKPIPIPYRISDLGSDNKRNKTYPNKILRECNDDNNIFISTATSARISIQGPWPNHFVLVLEFVATQPMPTEM
jgi:hypothetical protein